MKRISQSKFMNITYSLFLIFCVIIIVKITNIQFNFIIFISIIITVTIASLLKDFSRSIVTLYWDGNVTYRVGKKKFLYSQIINIVPCKEFGTKLYSIFINEVINDKIIPKEIVIREKYFSTTLRDLYNKLYLTNASS